MISVIGHLLRNVFTSWMGMVVTLVVTFFFTPFLIDQLGKGQYGIWSLVFSLVAYMRLADAGMNQAITRFCSKHFALQDWIQLNQVVSSAARIYVVISLVIVAASAGIAVGLLHYFQIEPESLRIARITLIVIGLNQAVTYMFIPFAALVPFHRTDIVNYFEMSQLLLQTAAIVVLLKLGQGLVAMSLVVLVLTIVSHVIRYGIRRRMFPQVKFSRSAIDREKTKQLLSYGSTSLLIVAAWIVIFQTDNIVIGRFISMEAIALFAVPAAIVSQLRNSISSIATPLVPTISHIEAEKDESKIMQIYDRSTRYLYFLSGFIGVMILVYGRPFILLWVGPDFETSVTILHLLIIPACIYLPQMIANSILFGVSRHKVLFYILAGEGVSNIVLSVILVQSMGLIGVALGTAIPQLVIYLVIYPVVFYRVMAVKVSQFYKSAARSMIIAAGLLAPVALLMRYLWTPETWSALIVDCAVAGAVMLTGFLALIVDPADRERLLSRLIRRSSGPQGENRS
ncbi:MAG: oligosaccharide flippase family protein [bacterium]